MAASASRGAPQPASEACEFGSNAEEFGSLEDSALTDPSGRRFVTLHVRDVSGEVHGPLVFGVEERVEQIQQWLEEETFRSLCVDEETNQWLARVEISTESGIVLDETRTLDEYHVVDGDTLYVVVIPWTSRSPGLSRRLYRSGWHPPDWRQFLQDAQ